MLATTILDHFGQAAAMLLLLELLVVLLIFLAITGGLAFGLWWVNRKTSPVFDKVNGYIPKAQSYAHRGTDYVALPFIKAGGLMATVTGTAEALRAQVRRARHATSPVASAPPPPSDEQPTEPMPLV